VLKTSKIGGGCASEVSSKLLVRKLPNMEGKAAAKHQ
jgi:hypothetical protein